MTITTQTIPWKKSGRDYPFVAKRSFLLTLDNPGATANEVFWGIQVIYTAVQASPPLVLVKSGDSLGTVNPIYAGLNGGIYAVAGRGVVSSGDDPYGTSYTVPPIALAQKLSLYIGKRPAELLEKGMLIIKKFVSRGTSGIPQFNDTGKRVVAIDPGYIVIGLAGDQSEGTDVSVYPD